MAKAAKKNLTTAVLDKGTRYDELKAMLDERRRVILQEVQGRIRGVRAEGADKPHESPDPGETAEVDIQEDIEFALIQMKAETLNKINEALARLDEGRYGHVLRVRRRNRRSAAPGAAVRGALQGLRRGTRDGDPARAYNVAARHVELPRPWPLAASDHAAGPAGAGPASRIGPVSRAVPPAGSSGGSR